MTDRDDQLDPSNNPRDAQREAKELKPNTEPKDEANNPLDREFEATDEHDLESRERQHDPLTDPEDNAEVNRVIPDTAVKRPAVTRAATAQSAVSHPVASRPVVVRQPAARPYLVSPTVLRNLFVAGGVAGTLLIVAILTLASSRDQARYTPADETQYERTLQEATDTITAAELGEGGQTARIPIDEAMRIVAAQGVGFVADALAAPAAEEAPPAQAEQAVPEQPQQAAETQPGQPVDEAGVDEAGAQAPQGGAEGVAAGAPDVLTAGQAVYEANCASCHQASGEGIPGAFPPLVGHVPALHDADRSYLINLLLYGLQGEIQVEGQTYNGVMPAWGQLSDDDIAGILNYTSTAWGNNAQLEGFQPYEAGEVTAARDANLSADDVYALRQELGLSGDE